MWSLDYLHPPSVIYWITPSCVLLIGAQGNKDCRAELGLRWKVERSAALARRKQRPYFSYFKYEAEVVNPS